MLRETRRLTQGALGERVNRTAASISQFEKGKTIPGADVVASLAVELEVDESFFFAPPVAPAGAPVFFRSYSAATKRVRVVARNKILWLRDLMDLIDEHLYIKFYDFESLGELPPSGCLLDEEIDDIALALRSAWNLPRGPIHQLTAHLESRGIVVVRLALESESMDGFSLRTDSGRCIIVLGTDKGSAARSRFDAAHELGHCVLHQGIPPEEAQDPAIARKLESQAHRFASAFLLPAADFEDSLSRISLEGFRDLKPYWQTSIAAMVMRSYQLGLIDEDSRANLFRAISRRGWRTREPFDGDTLPERPSLLRQSVRMMDAEGLDVAGLIVNAGIPLDIAEEAIGMNLADLCQSTSPRGRVVDFKSGQRLA